MKHKLPLGIIIDGLEPIPRVVDALLDHPYVATSDTAVTAPLYKFNEAIANAHRSTRSARDRLHVYLQMGVLDEAVRVQVAERFVAQYRQRFGRVERRDIFLASADIFRIWVTLKSLRQLDSMICSAVASVIRSEPHDAGELERELAAAGEALPQGAEIPQSNPESYLLELKLFLDNIHNPRRHKDPQVLAAIEASGFKDPAVLEFWMSPALPGYHWAVVGELAGLVGGIPVWMEMSESLR